MSKLRHRRWERSISDDGRVEPRGYTADVNRDRYHEKRSILGRGESMRPFLERFL